VSFDRAAIIEQTPGVPDRPGSETRLPPIAKGHSRDAQKRGGFGLIKTDAQCRRRCHKHFVDSRVVVLTGAIFRDAESSYE
jgi:hypothetical protein